MLFPLNLHTPQCPVFKLLNNEVLHFLRACISATEFSKALFSQHAMEGGNVTSVCWTNPPTRERFQLLWEDLPSGPKARRQLYELINGAQNIAIYFNDVTAPLPELPSDRLFSAFQSLTTHLYTRTKDLADAKAQAGSSIETHFQNFKHANNGTQLCFLCGTARLSQDRSGLDDDDQWRADYDHILCKDKYPIYSVHPGNFVPTCHICNSKAKGARNVLRCQAGNRRTAFYPLPPSQESCHDFAAVTLKLSNRGELVSSYWDSPLATQVSFPEAPTEIASKIEVWAEVYRVPARVEHEILTHFYERIAVDLLYPNDFKEFCLHLSRRSQRLPFNYNKAEWAFWWHRLYEYLSAQDLEFLNDIWSLIAWKSAQLDDNAFA
jgi:hypothetical protein